MLATELVPTAQSNAEVLFDRPFSTAEIEILKGVLDPSGSVELLIPNEIDPQRLWDCVEVCCGVVAELKRATDKIKPIVGRLLVVLKDHPEILQAHGYKNYEDFTANGMWKLFRIGRSEAKNCYRVAKNFPSLTVEEFTEIGVAKLWQIASATSEGERDCQEFVEFAKTHSVADVKKKVAKKKGMERGELDYAEICIEANDDIAKAWGDFVAMPEIQAYCETDSPARILACMIAEVSSQWLEQGRYLMNGGR
jgi:hypothetical protein